MSNSLGQFFLGTPAKFDQRTTLGPNQQPIQGQLSQAAQGQGAGGAFGDAADYFRSLLSQNPQQLQAMIAPEMRRYQQETIPGLAAQFSNIGAGGALSGSGFQNSLAGAGRDLSERIANLRAQMQMQGAQGLQGIGRESLGNYFSNTFQPRSAGFLEALAPALGQAATAFAGGGASQLSALLPFLQKLFQGQQNSGVE